MHMEEKGRMEHIKPQQVTIGGEQLNIIISPDCILFILFLSTLQL